jgi:pimeloyl-ACP methyl ester carboxylesterase
MNAIAALEIPAIDNEPALELLYVAAVSKRTISARAKKNPALLFVHGAYTDAWCWALTFMPYFAAKGYECYAVSVRGHGLSQGRKTLDFSGINDYARDVRRAEAFINGPIIVIGNSMGGLLIQREIAQGWRPQRAILLCAVPPSGMGSTLSSMPFTRPRLFAEIAQLALSGQPTAKFIDLLTPDPLDDLPTVTFLDHIQRESVRAIWEMTITPFALTTVPNAVPMLALHGEHDALVPASALRELGHSWQAECVLLPGMGHIPMLENRWAQVAQQIHTWMQ